MQKKKYRIIDEVKTESCITASLYSDRRQMQFFAKSLLKQKKYMYIDINEEKAIKLMNECSSSDDEDQVQKIGKKYVINLNNLQTKNSKGINYLFKAKEQFAKKDKTLGLLVNELKKSSQRLEKNENQRVNSRANLLSIYNAKSARQHSTKQSSINSSQACEFSAKKASPKKCPRLYSTISHEKSEASNSPQRNMRDTNYFLKIFLPTIKSRGTNKR